MMTLVSAMTAHELLIFCIMPTSTVGGKEYCTRFEEVRSHLGQWMQGANLLIASLSFSVIPLTTILVGQRLRGSGFMSRRNELGEKLVSNRVVPISVFGRSRYNWHKHGGTVSGGNMHGAGAGGLGNGAFI